jgi:hypothetical protein
MTAMQLVALLHMGITHQEHKGIEHIFRDTPKTAAIAVAEKAFNRTLAARAGANLHTTILQLGGMIFSITVSTLKSHRVAHPSVSISEAANGPMSSRSIYQQEPIKTKLSSTHIENTGGGETKKKCLIVRLVCQLGLGEVQYMYMLEGGGFTYGTAIGDIFIHMKTEFEITR